MLVEVYVTDEVDVVQAGVVCRQRHMVLASAFLLSDVRELSRVVRLFAGALDGVVFAVVFSAALIVLVTGFAELVVATLLEVFAVVVGAFSLVLLDDFSVGSMDDVLAGAVETTAIDFMVDVFARAVESLVVDLVDDVFARAVESFAVDLMDDVFTRAVDNFAVDLLDDVFTRAVDSLAVDLMDDVFVRGVESFADDFMDDFARAVDTFAVVVDILVLLDDLADEVVVESLFVLLTRLVEDSAGARFSTSASFSSASASSSERRATLGMELVAAELDDGLLEPVLIVTLSEVEL